MKNQLKINDQITVGGQPAEEELQQLKQQGFGSVINLRLSNEEDQPLSPEDEATKVRELGMDYLNIQVSSKQIRPEQVDEFQKALQALKTPTYVHCKGGTRAGAFAMMHEATRQGWSGDDTLKKAKQMGFECNNPDMVQFVKEYVDSRQK